MIKRLKYEAKWFTYYRCFIESESDDNFFDKLPEIVDDDDDDMRFNDLVSHKYNYIEDNKEFRFRCDAWSEDKTEIYYFIKCCEEIFGSQIKNCEIEENKYYQLIINEDEKRFHEVYVKLKEEEEGEEDEKTFKYLYENYCKFANTKSARKI